MNTYYMNDNTHNFAPILGINHQDSPVQDLIDTYFFGGGEVTQCKEGARATDTKIPAYRSTKEEDKRPKLMQGYTLLDDIELSKGKEYNKTVEDLFDKPEQF